MRLDADHGRVTAGSLLGSARHLVWLLTLAAGSATCAKTWVLGPAQGAGGAASTGGASGAAGGATAGGAPGFGGFPGSGGRSDSGTGGHSGSTCSMTKLSFDIPTADMTFFVGRNKSMSTAFGDSTRMLTVQTVLNQVLPPNQFAVNLGYQGFPSLNGCGNDCCPLNDPASYPAPGSAMAIYQNLRYCGPSAPMNGCVAQYDSRPMTQALNAMMPLFSPSDMAGDRYVVLITDGPPGCVSDDPEQSCTTLQMAVSALNRVGVKTYVIDIGDTTTADSCLSQVALAGGTLMSVFPVTDPTSLTSALTKIVAPIALASCTIELNQKPLDSSLVSIQFQGCEIQNDPTDGWTFSPGSKVRIEVQGSACAALQMLRASDVTVQYGCTPRMTPNPACP